MFRDSKKMNRKYILLILLPLVALCAGCTEEDYRNCPAGQYISFEPKNPKHNYRELVRTVDLLYYDASGTLAAEYNYTREQLRSGDYAAFVPAMEAGEYTLVAAVNLSDRFEVNEKQTLDRIYTVLKGETVSDVPHDFFTAVDRITVTGGWTMQEHTMMLIKHSNTIYLTVAFDGYTLPAGASLDAYIFGYNGMFRYADMYPAGMNTYGRNYTPQTRDGDRFTIGTMRLWTEADIELAVTQSDGTRAVTRTVALDLIEELMKVKDQAGNYLYDTTGKMEYQDEYEIVLTLGPDFVVLGLTINNWSVIGGGVEV